MFFLKTIRTCFCKNKKTNSRAIWPHNLPKKVSLQKQSLAVETLSRCSTITPATQSCRTLSFHLPAWPPCVRLWLSVLKLPFQLPFKPPSKYHLKIRILLQFPAQFSPLRRPSFCPVKKLLFERPSQPSEAAYCFRSRPESCCTYSLHSRSWRPLVLSIFSGLIDHRASIAFSRSQN